MKKLLIFFLLFSSCVFGQIINWVQSTGGVSIAADNSNNVFTISYEYNPAGDIYVTKRDANGNHTWTSKFDQTDNSKWEKAIWVETDNLGNAIVCGNLMSGYSNPVNAASIIMKFSPSGSLLWRHVYENSFDGSYTKKCIVDAANNIYVLGLGNNGTGLVSKVKKFAPDGSTVWTYYNTDGIGAPLNFKFTPDNGIVISGRGIYGSINGYAKLDINGNHIWSIAGINSISIGDAAGDSFGNTYIVHGVYGSNTQSTVKKINPTGGLIWQNNFDLIAMRVEVGTDNMPVACGYPNAGSFGSSFIKVNQNGTLAWANPDADSSFSLMLHAMLKLDQYNNAYLAAGTMFEMAVCRVNDNGSSGWTVTLPGGYANAIDIGLDNSIYVVGGSTAGGGSTFRIMQSLVSVNGSSWLIPGKTWLGDNYPNPFNPVTVIKYGIAKSGNVSIKIYDVTGSLIRIIYSAYKTSGNYEISFDGEGLSSGIYFYTLETGEYSETRKMVLIK